MATTTTWRWCSYLEVVQRFGDTTSAAAQLRALDHFGVTARLEVRGDFQLLEQQIARGMPVPCGYIHRGPVQRPSGGGHWLIVYGHTPSHVLVNDPLGEPDLIHGTTLNANGMGLRFSRTNFGYRWMVEPIGAGAYRYAPGRGWAWIEHPYGEEEICLLEEEEVLPAIERCMARVEEIDQALQREQELEVQRQEQEVAQRWPGRVATPWAAEPPGTCREPPLRQCCSGRPSAPQQPSTGAVRWAHSRGRWQGRGQGSGALMRVWES